MSIDMDKGGPRPQAPYVHFVGAGISEHTAYEPGMSYAQGLRASGLKLKSGMTLTVNGRTVKPSDPMEPNSEVTIASAISNG